MKKINNCEKKVLVTGASRGIGKSIATVLADEGYCVYVCARNKEQLQHLTENTKISEYIVCDLLNNDDLSAILKNSFDILINNAGDYVYSSVENTTDNSIKRLLTLNVEAPYRLIRGVVPYMKKQQWGRIVNIGSISGVVGEANASLYSMTKASLNGLTKALALELAQYGITVNTINPGWVDTELAKDAVENSDFSYQEEIDMIPQRRFIRPEEIAHLVKYMVSEEAKGMTGQSVSLCAGLSVG